MILRMRPVASWIVLGLPSSRVVPAPSDAPRSCVTCASPADMGFNIFFTIEMLMRMLGIRAWPPMGVLLYFKQPWLVFDFFMVILQRGFGKHRMCRTGHEASS